MKRCGFTALAERRLWVCCLRRGHKGQCFASRYDVERAFWEDWENPFEESETETDYLLRTFGPEGSKKVAAIQPRKPPEKRHPEPFVGVPRRSKWRDNVYGGYIADGVKSAVTWNGRKVLEHPTLDQLDSVHFRWD